MTAIVGVLNKHAISIAADSAVTLGSGKKVMNSANKLFALSKHHPVAIAVYGNAELIGTPWETIIKEFRNDFSDQSCDNLQGYADAFFQFLEKKKWQLRYLRSNSIVMCRKPSFMWATRVFMPFKVST